MGPPHIISQHPTLYSPDPTGVWRRILRLSSELLSSTDFRNILRLKLGVLFREPVTLSHNFIWRSMVQIHESPTATLQYLNSPASQHARNHVPKCIPEVLNPKISIQRINPYPRKLLEKSCRQTQNRPLPRKNTASLCGCFA